MANRIKIIFEDLRSEKRGGFIPFIVAGDPDLAATKRIILEFSKRGAAVMELGVPFSDPMADGVTIQLSAERALKNSISVAKILALVAELRSEGCETAIILFSYFNPIMQYGIEKFADEAKSSGVDGCLITDLVPEEASAFRKLLAARDLSLIMLAAPTSSNERLKKIAEQASGFIYAVSRAGVTGARSELSNDARSLVERIKKVSDLPVAVGFGISTAAQIKETCEYADAAVVGSAIVKRILELAPDKNYDNAAFDNGISQFLDELLNV